MEILYQTQPSTAGSLMRQAILFNSHWVHRTCLKGLKHFPLLGQLKLGYLYLSY